MKKEILKIFFKPLTVINRIKKKDDHLIFLYSNLGFRDNIRGFYDFLIAKEYHKKYKIVVSCGDYELFENDAPENVSFIGNKAGIRVFLKAKYAFYCFGKYPIKPAKTQTVINFWHGMPLKRVGNMEAGLEKIDYNFFTNIVATAPMFVPILMKCFHCSKEQVIVTGQPRNDEMFLENRKQDALIRKGAEKVIVWLPTYRDEEKDFPAPILNSENGNELNQMLKDNDARLIVKIHPLQQITTTQINYTNIEFISQEELSRENMTVYTLLRAADALISDYSSVFFDFMLLDRPIAFTVDDIEQYSKERGFVFEEPYEYMPGDKLSTFEDIKNFLSEVMAGKDNFREERHRVNNLVNTYQDGNSSERIANIVFK